MHDLNELQIFALTAQEMNFTRAAAALEISKAAVSRAIASLEHRLAIRLFERTTRRLALTEAGETYLVHARRAMENATDAEAAVSKLTAQPRGTLRVALPVVLARNSIAPGLARFLETYPEVQLELILRGGQIDPIADRVDVAFQTMRPAVDSQIIQRRLLAAAVGIYASKRYLKTAPPLQSPQDLPRHACLTSTTSHDGTIWSLRKNGRVQQVRPRSRVSVGDPVIHHRLCLDGAGVALMPEWEVRGDVKRNRLVRVLPEWMPGPIELYALYPTRLSMTPKLNVFLQYLESAILPLKPASGERASSPVHRP